MNYFTSNEFDKEYCTQIGQANILVNDMYFLLATWYIYIFKTEIEGPIKGKFHFIAFVCFGVISGVHSFMIENWTDEGYNFYKSELCSASYFEKNEINNNEVTVKHIGF